MDDQINRVFKALADESRRRILSALCMEPMVAGELGRLVGLAPNAVSFHLKELKSADLVSMQRQGRYLRYKINASVMAEWLAHVQGAFEPSATVEVAEDKVTVSPAIPPVSRETAPHLSHPSSRNDILPTELL